MRVPESAIGVLKPSSWRAAAAAKSTLMELPFSARFPDSSRWPLRAAAASTWPEETAEKPPLVPICRHRDKE